jgi:hypothetical protein
MHRPLRLRPEPWLAVADRSRVYALAAARSRAASTSSSHAVTT